MRRGGVSSQPCGGVSSQRCGGVSALLLVRVLRLRSRSPFAFAFAFSVCVLRLRCRFASGSLPVRAFALLCGPVGWCDALAAGLFVSIAYCENLRIAPPRADKANPNR